MFRLEGGRPGDARGFLHKSFIGRAVGGVAKRFIASTPVGQAVSFGQSLFTKGKARPVAPRSQTARPSIEGQRGKELARLLKFPELAPVATTSLVAPRRIGPPGMGSPCRPGESARCCQLRTGSTSEQRRWQVECGVAGEQQQRPRAGPTEVGEAVMGQFGAALEPGVMVVERSVCLPGMQLAKDGLCYNKGAITNSQRMWPRGRRPLLTGGDMRAIGIAARAGAKLDRTTKRLRGLGMMKALPKGRSTTRPHAHAKPVAAVSVT